MMMKKKEVVAEFTEDALGLRHAVFRTAHARPVLTLQGMSMPIPKLVLKSCS